MRSATSRQRTDTVVRRADISSGASRSISVREPQIQNGGAGKPETGRRWKVVLNLEKPSVAVVAQWCDNYLDTYRRNKPHPSVQNGQ